jgi:hypothetical protein
MEAIAAGPRFIAKVQPRPASREFVDQLANMIRPMCDRPQMADLAAAFSLRNRD